MDISDLIWLPDVVDKLIEKHQVDPLKLRSCLMADRSFVATGAGSTGRNLYAALGQTEARRYLIVYFIRKAGGIALVISARDIDFGERRQYGRK